MKSLRVVVFSLLCLVLSRVSARALGGPDILITLPPLSQSVSSGADVTFSVLVVALGTVDYQWLHGGKPIPGATNSTLTLHNVQLSDAGEYVAGVIKNCRQVDTSPAVLTVDGLSVQDLTGPVLTIQSPNTSYAKSVTELYTFSGTATDSSGVASLSYRHDDDPWMQAPITTSWSLVVPLHVGTNRFHLKATDIVGNDSVRQKVVVFYSVSEPISLQSAGAGQVVGAQDGQPLELCRYYPLRAVPSPGNYFNGWLVNGEANTNSTITLLMASNTVVRAEFLSNSLIAAQGRYVGLFYETNDAAHETAGFLSCQITDAGKVTGKLLRRGQTLSFSGQFGYDLLASLTIARAAPAVPLLVNLELIRDSDRLTGSVGDGVRSAVLEAYRSTFNAVSNPASLYVGPYTLALSGGSDASSSPFGHGYGLCSVTAAGMVTFSGALADGSTVTEKVPLAANGQWPLYVSLYRGKGSLFGWMTLLETATNDVHGLLRWTKPPGITGPCYTNGFTNEVTILGSRYAPPLAGVAALNLTNASVALEGGNLSAPLTVDVLLSASNKVTVASSNTHRVVVRLTPSSGLLTGSFFNPQTLRTSSIKGILLQKQSAGAGFWLGTNQSGAVVLGAPGQPLSFDLAP